jgi:hypothetical protein
VSLGPSTTRRPSAGIVVQNSDHQRAALADDDGLAVAVLALNMVSAVIPVNFGVQQVQQVFHPYIPCARAGGGVWDCCTCCLLRLPRSRATLRQQVCEVAGGAPAPTQSCPRMGRPCHADIRIVGHPR